MGTLEKGGEGEKGAGGGERRGERSGGERGEGRGGDEERVRGKECGRGGGREGEERGLSGRTNNSNYEKIAQEGGRNKHEKF